MQTVETKNQNNKSYLIIISILSVAIPLVVALLIFVPQSGKLGNFDVSILPHLNAVLNTSTAVALIVGFFCIKNNKPNAHRASMLSAFLLSSIFLISYVIYHFQAASTKFGDLDGNQLLDASELSLVGNIRYIYYFLLLTHIVLAAIIVPFVLLSVYYGLSKQLIQHKKISKWTFPLWLYVAVSGVIVYFMISPYYL